MNAVTSLHVSRDAAGMTPPRIAPVPSGVHRPLWSVMIPAYNCAKYLRQTLASVLEQDPGPELMQIEVVDDCSPGDDPEPVVREVGGVRVAFHRKPVNEGAIANFNSCISRARGTLLHILHGDDYVLPGFYESVTRVAADMPGMALFATRAYFVDEEGKIVSVSPRLAELEAGGRCVESFFYSTPLQTPGVVVRRAFYEAHGGFLPALIHTADCELWARAISLQGGCVTGEVLACYRKFAANDSGRLARSAENLRDIQRLNQVMADRYEHFDRRRALQRVGTLAMVQIQRFGRSGDRDAVKANVRFLWSAAPLLGLISLLGRELVRRIFQRMNRGVLQMRGQKQPGTPG